MASLMSLPAAIAAGNLIYLLLAQRFPERIK